MFADFGLTHMYGIQMSFCKNKAAVLLQSHEYYITRYSYEDSELGGSIISK